MKTVVVARALTTGLDPACTHLRTIEVEDMPLGQGGFGEVYRARALNGASAPPHVVKLLLGPSAAAARRGFNTTQELQRRLAGHDARLRSTGSSLIASHPALAGVPQVSFEGTCDGKPVVGYTASNLAALGMEDFADVLADPQKLERLQKLPLAARMGLAAQLVDAFEFLSTQASYIHADIKAEAIFVDLARVRCAVIDFDSGAVLRAPNDTPTTFGTRQDWLAPEIVAQLDRPGNAARVVHVDLLSDVWSVNMAVHYLLFGFSPLFFLTEVSERSMQAYAQQFRWPDANARFPFFRREYAQLHAGYVDHFRRRMPAELLERFAFTMNNGYDSPAARTSYGQWKSVLASRTRPAIKAFAADRTFIDDKRPVRLEWSVNGAMRLEVSGVGDVTGRSSVDVPVRADTNFTLTLIPFSGAPISSAVRVEVSKAAPVIHLFRGDAARLQASKPARLEWRVSGAECVAIDQGVGDVTGRSSVEVQPHWNCVYTLTATSLFGVTSQAQVKRRVARRAPAIAKFRTSRAFVRAGEEFVLEWDVKNTAQVTIWPGFGDVASLGRAHVHLARTTRFTLRVTSPSGVEKSASVVITVVGRCLLVPAARRTCLSSVAPCGSAPDTPTQRP